MAHVIVEIPEDVYGYAKKYNGSSMLTLREEEIGMCMNAIANGTPLQKGHGDLKDMDRIINCNCKNSFSECDTCLDSELCALLNEIPTIIEADKEGEHGTDSN